MEALTFTCEEAAKRHPGIEPRYFARLCIRGEWLLKKFGSTDKVPEKELRAAMFGKKVGKYWVIPVSELDRMFSPTKTHA